MGCSYKVNMRSNWLGTCTSHGAKTTVFFFLNDPCIFMKNLTNVNFTGNDTVLITKEMEEEERKMEEENTKEEQILKEKYKEVSK